MGAEIVSTVVEGFTSGGTGLATGFVQFFDGITKTAEAAEEIAAEKEFFEKINADGHDSYRVNTWRSLARIFAFMGFIPFFGLLMSLLSALFIWLAIKKGQTGMGKIIALAVFTFIIDVILILTIRS